MLTGSIASSLQGEPRSTRDIDVVIAIDKLKACELAREFSSPDFYLDEDSILDAIESQGMFNLIDLKEGDKGESLESLQKAIELDPKHKEGAKKDDDFKGLWDDEDFRKIVE